MSQQINPIYTPFLAAANDVREHLRTPFKCGDHTVYTNGDMLIATQCPCEKAKPDQITKDIEQTLINPTREAIENGDLFTIEKVEYTPPHCHECNNTGTTTTCPECYGDGEVELENDHHTYQCKCKTCRSIGRVKDYDCIFCPSDKHIATLVLGLPVKTKYLSAIQALPNPLFTKGPLENSIAFKFDGGIGLVMGISNNPNAKSVLATPYKPATLKA